MLDEEFFTGTHKTFKNCHLGHVSDVMMSFHEESSGFLKESYTFLEESFPRFAFLDVFGHKQSLTYS